MEERSNEKYVVTLVRDDDKPVNYKSEYPLSSNTAFVNIKGSGQYYLADNIPMLAAQNHYFNQRLDSTSAKDYFEKLKKSNGGFEYDEDWIKCWTEPTRDHDPRSCYKSTLVIPLTLWNNALSKEFVDSINAKLQKKIHQNKIERLIFGFLCFDHIKENFFQENKLADIEIGYVFADILSLYLFKARQAGTIKWNPNTPRVTRAVREVLLGKRS